MRKLIITLCSLCLMLGTAQAQQAGPGPGPIGDRVFEMPEEVVVLHNEVQALRETLKESRDALIAELGNEATAAEKIAALALWREENSVTIDELRTLSQELWALIRENRPDGRWAEIPEVVLTMREELKDARLALAESRREAILALGEDPTDEAVREAIAAWREANADALADVQSLAMELRDWFRDNRPQRPVRPHSPAMVQRRAEFRDNVAEMRQNRRELAQKMGDPELTPEARREIMQQFREEQRALLQERKALKRQERIDQGGGSGDRRPGG